MSAGIPDPGGVSGTFAALERTKLTTDRLVLPAADGGAPTTTSLVIADGTQVQHKNVLELIRDNLADFEEFGGVAFETRPFATAGGTQQQTIAILTEEHATLLLTYMRNSDIVRGFKKRLVRAFYDLRQARYDELRKWAADHQPSTPAIPQTYAEALRLAADEHEARELAEAKVAELEPKAEVADRILNADGDLSVRDAAQSLTRAGIKVGQNRLFAALEKEYGWISRAPGDGRYRVKQSAIESGYMSVIPQSHYHPKTGVLVLDPPQPRVTPKGLQRILVDHGGAS